MEVPAAELSRAGMAMQVAAGAQFSCSSAGHTMSLAQAITSIQEIQVDLKEISGATKGHDGRAWPAITSRRVKHVPEKGFEEARVWPLCSLHPKKRVGVVCAVASFTDSLYLYARNIIRAYLKLWKLYQGQTTLVTRILCRPDTVGLFTFLFCERGVQSARKLPNFAGIRVLLTHPFDKINFHVPFGDGVKEPEAHVALFQYFSRLTKKAWKWQPSVGQTRVQVDTFPSEKEADTAFLNGCDYVIYLTDSTYHDYFRPFYDNLPASTVKVCVKDFLEQHQWADDPGDYWGRNDVFGPYYTLLPSPSKPAAFFSHFSSSISSGGAAALIDVSEHKDLPHKFSAKEKEKEKEKEAAPDDSTLSLPDRWAPLTKLPDRWAPLTSAYTNGRKRLRAWEEATADSPPPLDENITTLDQLLEASVPSSKPAKSGKEQTKEKEAKGFFEIPAAILDLLLVEAHKWSTPILDTFLSAATTLAAQCAVETRTCLANYTFRTSFSKCYEPAEKDALACKTHSAAKFDAVELDMAHWFTHRCFTWVAQAARKVTCFNNCPFVYVMPHPDPAQVEKPNSRFLWTMCAQCVSRIKSIPLDQYSTLLRIYGFSHAFRRTELHSLLLNRFFYECLSQLV